jgi:hypothetical protein
MSELIEERYELIFSTAIFNADWLAFPSDDQSPVKESIAPIFISLVSPVSDGELSSSEHPGKNNKEPIRKTNVVNMAKYAEKLFLMSTLLNNPFMNQLCGYFFAA